jgi:hypothetical protein
MSTFQTEFSIKPGIKLTDFEDIVIEWISGNQYSALKRQLASLVGNADDRTVRDDSGEALVFKRLTDSKGFIAGARHEIPDDAQRLWRTEVVCRVQEGLASAVSVRVQCLATDLSVRAKPPKRPYIVKLMLHNAWPISAGKIFVSDTPFLFPASEAAEIAEAVSGTAGLSHPVVYLSRDDNDELALDPDKLAYDLGGVAHVLVEPSRLFSFKLMDLTDGKNPYGGTVGISVSGGGCIKRLFIGSEIRDGRELERAVISFASQIVSSQRLALGCDWQNLQELQTFRAKSEIESQVDAKVNAYIEAFDQENRSLKEKVRLLEEEIAELAKVGGRDESDRGLRVGSAPEIYPGEVRDRLRFGIECLLSAQKLESARAKFVLQGLLAEYPYSGGARALYEQIKAAGKDTSEMPQRLGGLLSGLSFESRSDGKHTVFSPPEGLGGIGPITVPKSPSEYKAGRNLASDVINEFSLNDVLGKK